MLAITRRTQIKELVFEKKSATVAELAKKLFVTEETIRRDLKVLEDDGALMKTHGGAFVQDGVQNEVDLTIREMVYVDGKKRIAEKCAEFIYNGDSIFLDDSTTAMFLGKAIRDKRITVLTNSLKTANLLTDNRNIKLILIGGVFNPRSMSFMGVNALKTFGDYFVDKAFISCRTLSLEHGVTDSNEDTAEMRKQVLKQANSVYIVADHSKFGSTSFIKICDYKQVSSVVTDKSLSAVWHELFAKTDVKLYECED